MLSMSLKSLRAPMAAAILLLGATAATAAGPVLIATPDPLEFPHTVVGSSTERAITVTNVGDADLNISAVSLVGPDASSFQVDETDCLNPVSETEECAIVVRFQPATQGEVVASVVISSDAPSSPDIVELFGASTICGGLNPTLVGTTGRDTLVGTPGVDVIDGLGGNDHIVGQSGDDVICGRGGDDMLIGGPGKDQMFGGDGNDKLVGSSGKDALFGEAGNDKLIGGSGGDLLVGGDGDDRLLGRGGPDALKGGQGSDACVGGLRNDRARGCEKRRQI